jgi:tetratricopeptide (TPR) repeat protein
MVRLRVTAHQLRPYWVTGRALAVIVLSVFLIRAQSVCGLPVQGISEDPADSATLQGSVRDSRGRPAAAATVYLQDAGGTQTLSVRTDSDGAYRFSALRGGVYNLRAKMAGYRDAAFGPCVLGPQEVKAIDLMLESQTSGQPSSEKPEFFDEPQFTVAGVTEAMNPGGHGSDTILRTTEALAKETVSLAPASPQPAPTSATAEESLRKLADSEPGNFDANRRLGKLLVDDGKAGEALPYLERASQLNPGDDENAYELALAYVGAGQYKRARVDARTLLTVQDKASQDKARQADVHHLLGEIEEKLGNPLEAVREYQRAAELNPSENNLFDWGAELLTHRAFEPAIEVFAKGNRVFPRSVRMLAGLGVAWYARGSYDRAAQYLCEASDLNPSDPDPYLLMGKMQSVETIQSKCQAERLGRFVRLQPENALANYYYALSLRKRGEGPGDASNAKQAGALLEKAVQFDPKLGSAYLQLGILYSDQGDLSKAVRAFQEATDASPQLEEAHFRLAQAYSRMGEKWKAHAELQLYDQLSKKTAEQVERERREIQQFVYTLRGSTPGSQPQ